MPPRKRICRISTKKWSPPVVKQMLTKMSRTKRLKEFGKRWRQKDMQKLQERIVKTYKILLWIIKSSKLTRSRRANKKYGRKVLKKMNASSIQEQLPKLHQEPHLSDQFPTSTSVGNIPLINNASTFQPVGIPPFPPELVDFYTMEEWIILNTY